MLFDLQTIQEDLAKRLEKIKQINAATHLKLLVEKQKHAQLQSQYVFLYAENQTL